MYLDWNATAPLSERVRDFYMDALLRYGANAHSQHQQGRDTSVAVEKARENFANCVGVVSKQVRFTSGATEGNSWILSTFAKQGSILTSAIEHPSVLEWSNAQIAVNADGEIDLASLKMQLQSQSFALVSVMAANNESGVIQPIGEIFEICQHYQVPFHCDASQVINRIDPDISADYMTFSGHKMGAPKGVGAVVLKNELTSLLKGGPQERGSRAGTLNSPAIVTMSWVASQAQAMDNHYQILLEESLKKHFGATVIGEAAKRLPNTSLVKFRSPGDMVVMVLDMLGIAVSTGSACSSGSSKQSNVLKAMGLDGIPVRFSWGHESDIPSIIPIIINGLQNLENTCEW